ncbi:MAG TPA: hypothetical protein VFH93_11995 [Thermoleophilia bacterium]|nr:hypothetical protein [Thermoleophilia bacterium]
MANTLDDPAPPPDGGRTPGEWYAGPAPRRHSSQGLVLARLTAVHAELDHAALMASAPYLRRWSDSDWPADDFTVGENRRELGWHDEEHAARVALTYSLLDAVERRVLGCVYVRPLRDMLRTRGVEPPADPDRAGDDTPCIRGWVRRDEPEVLELRFLGVVTGWLTGPEWAFPELWWTAASDDARQLAALDELGWTREVRIPMADATRDWVFRAPQLRPSS